MAQIATIRLIEISSPEHYAIWNALSVETLAGDLRGYFGDLVNVSIDRIRFEEDILRVLKDIKHNPSLIIGISVEVGSLEWTKQFSEGLTKLFNFSGKLPLIVFGNKIPTNFPEYFLKLMPNAIIVIGEGEESLRGLVEHVLKDKPLEDIPNLVFRNDFRIIKTSLRSPDLTTLVYPPSVDTITDPIRLGGNALLQASRGCSWSQCTYCTTKSFRKGKKWEGFPISRILENIEKLVYSGITELEFADDEFFGGVEPHNFERIYEIADGLEKIRNSFQKNITFRIFLIPHTIYRKNRLKKNQLVKSLLLRLKEVGLVKIYFGAESGCPSQLKRYNRGYTIQELHETILILQRDINVDIDVGFVMFDPELNLCELLTNINFFRKMNLIKSNQWPFRRLIINVGSPLYDNLKQTSLLGNLNINYMSYEYNYVDDNVANIFSIIDKLSYTTRPIFYALKVISKKQFCPAKKGYESILAQHFIENNGDIYLETMDNLAKYFMGDTYKTIDEIIDTASKRIDHLVMDIYRSINNGNITDSHSFIYKQIDGYLQTKHRHIGVHNV